MLVETTLVETTLVKTMFMETTSAETMLAKTILVETTSAETMLAETMLVETKFCGNHVSRNHVSGELPESLIRGKSCSLSSLSWIFTSPSCYCNEKGGKKVVRNAVI